MELLYKNCIGMIASLCEITVQLEETQTFEPQYTENIKQVLEVFGVPTESRIFELLGLLAEDATDEMLQKELLDRLNRWIDAQTIMVANRTRLSSSYKTRRLGCDRKFAQLADLIRKNKNNALKQLVMTNLQKLKKERPELYKQLTVGYRGWYFENNIMDGFEGPNNSLIDNRISTLKKNLKTIEWLYDNLEDNLSRMTLNALVDYWLTFNLEAVLSISIYTHEAVDVNILPFYGDEVFVDCGAYIGDTVAEYVNQVNMNHRRIYSYEISPKTVELQKANLKEIPNVVINTKGVGEVNEELTLVGVDNPHEGNHLDASGNMPGEIKVPVVRLDDDIDEPVTFLKIDVEGLDKEAIRGAAETIRRYHPKIQVDAYHKLADFFSVPQLIQSIDPSYCYYLRIANSIDNMLKFPRPSIYAL